MKTACKYDMEISIITNGSHLENIRPFAHMISQVGISVDSLEHQTNMEIGVNVKVNEKVNVKVNVNKNMKILKEKGYITRIGFDKRGTWDVKFP